MFLESNGEADRGVVDPSEGVDAGDVGSTFERSKSDIEVLMRVNALVELDTDIESASWSASETIEVESGAPAVAHIFVSRDVEQGDDPAWVKFRSRE